jgi:thiosulfate/3-mercaptopyruvate sulfurtransferase
MTDDGYPNGQLLAETDWLAEQLDAADVRVVDCRTAEAYAEGHIPGARALPVHNYLKDEGGVHVMGPEAFGDLMERLGIGERTTVVAYDDNGGLSATRFWWVLHYYGHDRAKVLNGALQKWAGEGRPVAKGPSVEVREAGPSRPVTVRKRAEILAEREEVQACVPRRDTVILDVRSEAEHRGAERRQNRRAGHIPGAVNVEWTRALVSDGPYRVWRPAGELRAMYEAAGVTPDKRIVTH